MVTPPLTESRAPMKPGRELDADVAAALGYKAWREKRGEYSLCVVQDPGEKEPWIRVRRPDPERYTEVACADAVRIGFFGTGFPMFSTDIAAAWLVVERMKEIAPIGRKTLRLVGYEYGRTYAVFAADPELDEVDWQEGNGKHATPFAICLAALAAVGGAS